MAVPTQLVAELKAVPGVRLWTRAPLAQFTTIGAGGSAALLVSAACAEAVASVLGLLERAGVDLVALGAGSNILVADRGFEGAVVKLDEPFQYVEGPGARPDGHAVIVAGAALALPRLATFAAEAGLSGLEFVCGIPGTVGGGVAMNAGAHGHWLSEVVEGVEVVGPGGVEWLSGDEVEWGYRSCRLPLAGVVTAVRMTLTADSRDGVVGRHRELLRVRRATQPRGVRTFGSTFKNPLGDSAGRLLDLAGMRGARRGGAQVSGVHANFIVNVGDATATDVLALMTMMRGAVWHRFEIELEPEVRLLGADFPWQK
jgi:UDP-N-acetylenolpyruvoylglucosamine reductase